MTRGTFLPGVRSGDVRYERQQAKLAQSLARLPRMPLGGINLDALRPWIARRLTELVGIDDEVLTDFFWNTLEAQEEADAGEVQLLLTQFMGKSNAETFAKELWGWLAKAKEAADGIPEELRSEYQRLVELKKTTEEAEQRRRHQVSDVVVRRHVQRQTRSAARSRSCSRSRSRPRSRSRSRSRSPVQRPCRRRSRSRSRTRRPRHRHYSRSPSQSRSREPLRSSRSMAPSRDRGFSNRQAASPPRDTLRRRERETPPPTPPRSPAPSSSSYSTDEEAEDEAAVQLIERAKQLMTMD